MGVLHRGRLAAIIALLLFNHACYSLVASLPRSTRSNVLFIITDDQGGRFTEREAMGD